MVNAELLHAISDQANSKELKKKEVLDMLLDYANLGKFERSFAVHSKEDLDYFLVELKSLGFTCSFEDDSTPLDPNDTSEDQVNPKLYIITASW